MPQKLALFFFVSFSLWLFARDRKLRPMTSGALWIPLLWIIFIGSRSISAWFGHASLDEYGEGNPIDRNVNLLLFVAGLFVLLMRRINWGDIFSSNKWVFLFFIYCGISIIWSDYPLVSLKKWTKDIGNVVMVLIILTDKEPLKALRAVLARFAYFAIPFSVLLIIFFPDIGTSAVEVWSNGHVSMEQAICGVTTNKNSLGLIVFVCGLFLLWDFTETRVAGKKNRRADLFGRAVLMSMVIWLIASAHSATAYVGLLLGTGIFLIMRFYFQERQIKYLGTYCLIFSLPILFLYIFPGILQALLGIMGKDITLTGRTDLWADLLRVSINPIIGTGYESFWLGQRAEDIWRIYTWHPLQAHNGYLETYLNVGLIGVCLLIAVLLSAGRNLKKEMLKGNSFGFFGFSFLVVALYYNITEAKLGGSNPIWFILLLSAMSYTRRAKIAPAAISLEGKMLSITPKNLTSKY
jgi:exopolysaccharide production protein ExoQ